MQCLLNKKLLIKGIEEKYGYMRSCAKKKHRRDTRRCFYDRMNDSLLGIYFAKLTDLVSRMTVILTCPG